MRRCELEISNVLPASRGSARNMLIDFISLYSVHIPRVQRIHAYTISTFIEGGCLRFQMQYQVCARDGSCGDVWISIPSAKYPTFILQQGARISAWTPYIVQFRFVFRYETLVQIFCYNLPRNRSRRTMLTSPSVPSSQRTHRFQIRFI